MKNLNLSSKPAASWFEYVKHYWDTCLYALLVIASLVQVFLWLWPKPPRILPLDTPMVEVKHPLVKAPPMSSQEDVLLKAPVVTVDSPAERAQTEQSITKPHPVKSPITETLKPMSLNHASAIQLEALPRIGPKLAARIIDYRRAHGPFHNVAELDNVKGIGPKMLETLTPYLRFP